MHASRRDFPCLAARLQLVRVGARSLLLSLVLCACSSTASGSAAPWSRPEMPLEPPALPNLECVDTGNGACVTSLDTDALFRTGDATLTGTAIAVVEQLAHLIQNRGGYVQLVGHADGQGDSESNQTLSEQRVNSIRDALIERGVAEEVISACGMGDVGAEPQVDDQSFRRVDAIMMETAPAECPVPGGEQR